MADGDQSSSGVARKCGLGAGFLVVVGLLADLTGLFGFVTGMNLPSLRARPSSSSSPTADTPNTGVSSNPTVSTPPAKGGSTHRTVPRTSTPMPTKRPVASTPGGKRGAVKNFQLSVTPGAFRAADPRTILIETLGGSPGAFVDMEIADPTANGGVCPKLTNGGCNLLHGGAEQADGSGRARLRFEWFGDEPGHDGIHHPGTYIVTVRDRGTGKKLSIDFTAE